MASDEELMARYVAGESEAFHELFDVYAPRAATECSCRFEDGNRNSVCRQFHRGRHSCPAAAYYCNITVCVDLFAHAASQVRHAIHNLRIGVMLVRVVRMSCPANSIFRSNAW